jgi:mono/diheme cytochrome c family protein
MANIRRGARAPQIAMPRGTGHPLRLVGMLDNFEGLTSCPLARMPRSLASSFLVLAVSALAAPLAAQASGAEGRYSADQASRGEAVYRRECGECHSIKDHSNEDFRFSWNGRSALQLFESIRNTMPEENPGSLTRQQYADIVAYLMKANGMPSGPRPLTPDSTALKAARFEVKDARQR